MEQKRYNIIFLSEDPPVDTNVIWANKRNELLRWENGWKKLSVKYSQDMLPNPSDSYAGVVRIGDNVTLTQGNVISITNENIINALGYIPAQEAQDGMERITEAEIFNVFNSIE